MSALVWKLLRQHISIGQLAGFFFAHLLCMMIVFLRVLLYNYIIPVSVFYTSLRFHETV